MTFNEFQRELKRLEIPDNIAYVLTVLYERFGQILNEHELMAQSISVLADNTRQFVTLREQDREAIIAMQKKLGSKPDVRSEEIGDDPTKKH